MKEVLELNKKAWNRIGSKTASPYIKQKKCREIFDDFCKQLPKNGRVLDFGCGPGIPFTRALIEAGLDVTAIDLSETMIAELKNNVPEAKGIVMSMTETKFQEEFDGVFSSYSFLCLPPELFKTAANNCVKAMKPGALAYLSLNETQPGEENDDTRINIGSQDMYSRSYTEKEVRQSFSELEIIRVERELVQSEMYGEEHSLIFLMKKRAQ